MYNECGDDGYGGSCGECGSGSLCSSGKCLWSIPSTISGTDVQVVLMTDYQMSKGCDEEYGLDVDSSYPGGDPSDLCPNGVDNVLPSVVCYPEMNTDLPVMGPFLQYFQVGEGSGIEYDAALVLDGAMDGGAPFSISLYKGELLASGDGETFVPYSMAWGELKEVSLVGGHLSGGGPGSFIQLDGLVGPWLTKVVEGMVSMECDDWLQTSMAFLECIDLHVSSARIEADLVTDDTGALVLEGVLGGTMDPSYLEAWYACLAGELPDGGTCAGDFVDVDTDGDGAPDAISIGIRIGGHQVGVSESMLDAQ